MSGHGHWRDARKVREAMSLCLTPLAAKVLLNDYRRSCEHYVAHRRYPLWLKKEIRTLERQLRSHFI